MFAIRHLLAHRRLAVPICAAALLMKLLVPTGFMIATDHGRLSIVVCPGTVPSKPGAAPMVMGDHAAMADHAGSGRDDAPGDHGEPELPCAFAGLSAASLGAVDPVQLAALVAFVMGLGLAALPLPSLPRRQHLRPPLRGPPVTL